MKSQQNSKRSLIFAAVVLLAGLPLLSLAQTAVKLPKNKYKVEEDVQLGRRAAREVEQKMPIMNDAQAEAYVERVGARLVAAIPPEFRQPAFDYSFKLVNASDINAFALPGGPMFVNRGMIEAAKNEGEMAGVMAHEISHVALRHATAQQTKQSNPLNQILGIGAVVGGGLLGGQAGAQAGQMAVAGYFLRYSREYETQADVLGARILADAGYDPRDLANMFQTIAGTSRGGGPEWLSSHPDPGNRYQKINKEAEFLNVSSNPIKVTRDFERIQSRLRGMPRARSMSQIEQDPRGNTDGGVRQGPTSGGRYMRTVAAPSARMMPYNYGPISMDIPENWVDLSDQSVITLAPEGAYGNQGITHGAMIGVRPGKGSALAAATQDYVDVVLQGNSYLSQRGASSRGTVAGRPGLVTTLVGRSIVTNKSEVVTLITTQLRNGNMFYIAAIAPEDEVPRYTAAFRGLLNSLTINE